MKRTLLVAIVVSISVGFLVSTPLVPPNEVPRSAAPGDGTVVFAAGGDHTNNSIFQAGLDNLKASGAEFYVAIGDLGFTGVGNERSWCENIKAKLGTSFPFQLISGNHDEDGSSDGWIGNYVQWCQDHMNSVGTYGSQYYFDYPATNPLIRVISLPAAITVFGIYRGYSFGSPEYTWASDTIDDARAIGIPWVVVGIHKVCVTTGPKSCEVGTDLYDLLINKKVDLILHGHVHTNERSKQLSCVVPYSYDPACIVDDGSDNLYSKGAGPVVVIGGPMGQGTRPPDLADPEANYFAKLEGGTSGFYRYAVTSDRIDATYVAVQGSHSDSFTIGSGSQPFTVTVNPATGTVNPAAAETTAVQVFGVSSDPVSLSTTGCPPASTCSFSPSGGAPPFSSILTVATDAGTPLAAYPMIIAGSNSTRTDSANYTLMVTQTVTRTYQKGDGGAYSEIDDTYIYDGSRNSNYGTDVKLYTDTSGCIQANTICKTLIRFPDIIGSAPGQIPLGAQIQSAALEITVTDSGGINNIHQLTEAWQEMTATWNSFATSGSPGAMPAFASTTPAIGRMSIDVKTAVQAWANGETNMGVLLDPTSGDGADFDSSESANPEKLTVVYATGTPPDINPSMPLNLRASLDGTLSSVVVSWNLPPVEIGVDHYEVLSGSTYDPTGSGYVKVSSDPGLPAGSTSWIDADAGLAPGPQFYTLRAVASSGNYSQVHGQAAKFTRALTTGPKPVSTSVIHPTFEIRDNLRGSIGVSVARIYEAGDAVDPWKRYDPNRPDQEYDSIDRTVGVWLGVSMAGDLRIAGVVPCATTITLLSGWNFVGYPSMTVRTVSAATGGLVGPLALEGYDPTAAHYFLRRLGPSDLMGPTEAYWIYSPVTQAWVVTNDASPGCVGSGGYRPAPTSTREFLQVEGSDIVLGGKRVRLIGGNSYGILTGYVGAGHVTDLEPNMTRRFVEAGQYHLKVIRFWLDIAPSDYWFGKSYGLFASETDHAAYFAGLDALIADAKANGILLVPVFVSAYDQFTAAGGGTNFWTVGGATNVLFKDWVGAIVDRYRDETQIAWWELGNEANYFSTIWVSRATLPEVIAWAQDLNAFVKARDPNHLVEGGWNNMGNMDMATFDAMNEFLDIASHHIYDVDLYALQAGQGITDQRTAVDDYVMRFTDRSRNVLGKPILFGEFGGDLYADPNNPFVEWFLESVYDHNSDVSLVWSWEEGYASDRHVVSPTYRMHVAQSLNHWSDMLAAWWP